MYVCVSKILTCKKEKNFFVIQLGAYSLNCGNYNPQESQIYHKSGW
jgi:hypothetical protein